MKQWSKEIEIHAPIDIVWGLLNGSLEDMQRIMPQVVDHQPVKVTNEGVGSIYRQKYREGKRVEEYDVETLEFENSPDQKKLKVGFSLAKMFEITALYELTAINEQNTLFKYTCTNKPLKAFLKLFLLLASDKIVVQFCERVKKVAEEEYKNSNVLIK
ncbi:SRPBCC family protein [Bacillus sp. UNC41MFS5]|uniref:SRPBCC family protein n=1 Tax=Bacillus sp. UNC41MFS5 TaxID=1449046 RepID=UPI00047D73A7|nr:SRPBCC family protein [Bacillus sp. UNC41MFS5]